MKNQAFNSILLDISTHLSQTKNSVEEGLQWVCKTLKNNLTAYQWVGFYFAEPITKTLHLKAYAGAPTDHTVIPFGKGICGQVALSNAPFVVPDVTLQDNYIACSVDVRSEIVVPLFLEEKNIGQIDIDSHQPDPFGEEDTQFLEAICKLIADTYGNALLEI